LTGENQSHGRIKAGNRGRGILGIAYLVPRGRARGPLGGAEQQPLVVWRRREAGLAADPLPHSHSLPPPRGRTCRGGRKLAHLLDSDALGFLLGSGRDSDECRTPMRVQVTTPPLNRNVNQDEKAQDVTVGRKRKAEASSKWPLPCFMLVEGPVAVAEAAAITSKRKLCSATRTTLSRWPAGRRRFWSCWRRSPAWRPVATSSTRTMRPRRSLAAPTTSCWYGRPFPLGSFPADWYHSVRVWSPFDLVA
jgi:hypothetical protein